MTTKKDKSEVWESGIKVLKYINVIVPIKLLLICNQIASKIKSNNEFSILTNITEQDDETIILSEDYYIPKQIVEYTAIEYLPDEKDSGYKVVIHRHPDGMNGFSSTDQAFINQNFDLSILYTERDEFVHGIYNLRYNDYMIQIPINVIMDNGVGDIDISNIEYPAPLVPIDRPRKSKARNERRISDLEQPVIPEQKDKLLPEETMDYGLMKEFMLEDVDGELQDINYRLTNLEETIFHNTGFNSAPF